MTISIIICTRNRADSLRETLRSVGRCDVPADLSAELLVVDNASTDHTAVVVQAAEVANMDLRFVQERRPGLSHARNRGLAEANGDVILFIDDDIRVLTGWLEAMVRPILSGTVDATTGQVDIAPHLRPAWLTAGHREHLTEIGDRTAEHDDKPFLIGANMAFHRRVLRDVRGFEPALGAGALGYMEETLFHQQLIVAGYRIGFISGVPVEHHFDPSRLTRKTQLRCARAHGRSAAWLMYHWSHDDVPYRKLQLIRNAIAIARRRFHWFTGPRIGFDPAEVVFTIRYWVCRELGRLQGAPRRYEQKGLHPTGREATPPAIERINERIPTHT